MPTTVKGTETIVNPLQKSGLNKKGLCDYVINVASGCLHGCTFCYVPSTPAIRTKQTQLKEQGVNDPQMDWGKYLFIREDIPEKLDKILSAKRKPLPETHAGQGIVLLCSGTDPYQNKQTAMVTRETVKVLLKHQKKVRILTRSPLWENDIDILKNPNVIVGMSLPYLDDSLSKQIEPSAPPPSRRYEALLKGYKEGCRLYVAVAPTPPNMTLTDFKEHLTQLIKVNPEVIFWEPINARGTNGKRMVAAGLEFVHSVMTKTTWAECFKQQWESIETAAAEIGCLEKLHIWPDPELRGHIEDSKIEKWFYKRTLENWNGSQ